MNSDQLINFIENDLGQPLYEWQKILIERLSKEKKPIYINPRRYGPFVLAGGDNFVSDKEND